MQKRTVAAICEDITTDLVKITALQTGATPNQRKIHTTSGDTTQKELSSYDIRVLAGITI